MSYSSNDDCLKGITTALHVNVGFLIDRFRRIALLDANGLTLALSPYIVDVMAHNYTLYQ